MALTAIVYGILYFLCAGGPGAFKMTCSGEAEVDQYAVADDLKIGDGKRKFSGNWSRTSTPRLSFTGANEMK